MRQYTQVQHSEVQPRAGGVLARTVGLLILATLTALSGCSMNPAIKESRELAAAGRSADALDVLDKASKISPDNHAYRVELFRQRELALAQWLSQGELLRYSNEPQQARTLYERILKYDPQNSRARVALAQLETEQANSRVIAEAAKLMVDSKYAEAQDKLRPLLNENPNHREARRLQRQIDDKTVKPAITTPQLKITSNKPLSIELRDVTLRSVFDVISRSTGLSFVFDKDIRADLRTSIAVRDTSVEELLRLLLSTNQLEQKQVNPTTLIIYPNTPQKQREYQELVIRSFYLANADVKVTANMVRTLIKTRDIFIDEKLNLLVLRDTPSAIRMAEKLIQAQDLAEPEVMLEVEVLEIASNRLMALGIKYPDSVALSLVGGGTTTTTAGGTGTTTGTTTTSGGTPGILSLPEWLNRSAGLVRLAVSNPAFTLTLRQQDGATSVLANPRIRVKNKEKAKIHIGDRVPVITTTAAAAGGFVSESVSYLDVGLKLEVEPLIYLDDEVGIKVGLEVSSIVREIRGTNSNTLTYQVGTRNAVTSLRLRDGETQILAGLISDEDRRSANRVPVLGQLPILGRLFSDTSETGNKSEIVLLITPRLVRTLAIPDQRVIEFSAGTEASAGAPASGPGFAASPFATTPAPTPKPPAPQPAAQPSPSTLVPFGGLQTPR